MTSQGLWPLRVLWQNWITWNFQRLILSRKLPQLSGEYIWLLTVTPSNARNSQQLLQSKKRNTFLRHGEIGKFEYNKITVLQDDKTFLLFEYNKNIILPHSCLLIFAWKKIMLHFFRLETILASFLHLMVLI